MAIEIKWTWLDVTNAAFHLPGSDITPRVDMWCDSPEEEPECGFSEGRCLHNHCLLGVVLKQLPAMKQSRRGQKGGAGEVTWVSERKHLRRGTWTCKHVPRTFGLLIEGITRITSWKADIAQARRDSLFTYPLLTEPLPEPCHRSKSTRGIQPGFGKHSISFSSLPPFINTNPWLLPLNTVLFRFSVSA